MIERAKEKYAPPHRRRRGKMRTGEGRLIKGWNGGRSGAPNNCVSLREERARHTERARRLKRTRTARRDDRAASRASTETEGGADRKWTAFSQPPGRELHPKPSDPGDFCSDRRVSGPKSLISRFCQLHDATRRTSVTEREISMILDPKLRFGVKSENYAFCKFAIFDLWSLRLGLL